MNITDEVHKVAHHFLEKVRRSGPNNIMAICPFHMKADGSPEKRPSFAMNLSSGLYFCHACQAKGNLFTFLREIGLGRDVIERQYRLLIDAASSNLPPPSDPLNPIVFDLPTIPEAVLGLFDYCPTSLLDAGFDIKTLHHFEVGYDKWYQRITYPLRDLKGRLVGISGRSQEGVRPKYKVYTEEYKLWDLPVCPEPDKRAILWNVDKVYPEVYFTRPDQNFVVIVEGFKACMWVYQAGIKNVLALLGTYLSWEHKWMLERLGMPVYMFLDNDTPGRSGTIKAADSLSRSLPVHVVNYPNRLSEVEEAQPDTCHPDEVVHQVACAPSYLMWLMQFD